MELFRSVFGGGSAEQLAAISAALQPGGGTWRELTTRNARRLLGI